MIKLQIYKDWGGISHKVDELDIGELTPEQVSEVIVKQQSKHPGCWTRVKRYPGPAEAEAVMIKFIDNLIANEGRAK